MPSRDNSPTGRLERSQNSESNVTSSTSQRHFTSESFSSNVESSGSNFATFGNDDNFKSFTSGQIEESSFGGHLWPVRSSGQHNESSSAHNFVDSSEASWMKLNNDNNETTSDSNVFESSSENFDESTSRGNIMNRTASELVTQTSSGGKSESGGTQSSSRWTTGNTFTQTDTESDENQRSATSDIKTLMGNNDNITSKVDDQSEQAADDTASEHTITGKTSTKNKAQSTESGSGETSETTTAGAFSENNENETISEPTGATSIGGAADEENHKKSIVNEASEHDDDEEQIQRNNMEDPIGRDSFDEPSERTPLLARDEEEALEDEPTKKSKRWPSIIALTALCVVVILAIVFGFAAPAAVEEYAKEAITFETSSFAVESFKDVGVDTRVQGIFYLDGSKVQKPTVRALGRAATWIAHEVETSESEVDVYLPEYSNFLLGIVKIPAIKLDIRDGNRNYIDIRSNFQPGNTTGIQTLAKDFLGGKKSLDVIAIAKTTVKSGILNLGTKTITQAMTLHRSGDMKMPKVHVAGLLVGEYGLPGRPEGLVATANVSAMNPYPVEFDLPPLTFEIMMKDCASTPLILGTVGTKAIHVDSNSTINAEITGYMQQIPTALTTPCNGTKKSSLDEFIGSYLGGNDTQLYVRGGEQDDEQTPPWIGQILRDVLVPVPVPHHTVGSMVKNFSMSNVHFAMPALGAKPYPEVSANIHVVVGLPKFVNIDVSVDRVRADADVYFKGKKLGVLDLNEWQESNSSIIAHDLHVQSIVKNAPLQITDQDVFTEVLQTMIFGGQGLKLDVQARIDVRTTTVLGQFIVRQIPSNASFSIKDMGGEVQHTVKDISVADSTPDELIMQAKVKVVNPTDYSAIIPYFNISTWCNETQLGYAWGSLNLGPGVNELVVYASYRAGPVGAELLSQYISGGNTSLTLKTHNGSLPGLPNPNLSIDVPMPHTFGKFMGETTMHILSSSATFTLISPLPMIVTSILAHAYYNGTEIGTITYDDPIEIEVGENVTPYLPVDWNLNGGLKLIRDAIGGTLKLDAHADVGVRIGNWEEKLWYEGHGIGAKISLFMD